MESSNAELSSSRGELSEPLEPSPRPGSVPQPMKESTPQRRPQGPPSSLQRHGVVACAQVLSGAQGSRHCGPSRPRVAANLSHFRCLMIDPSNRRRGRRESRQKSPPYPKPLFRLSPAYAPPSSKCLPYPAASPFFAAYQSRTHFPT